MKKVNYTPRKHTRFRDLKSIKDVFKDLKKYHRVIDLNATATTTQKEGIK
ncbi:MAG: hypothetical protein QXI16_00460 [Sulfolobaceae archaeon]